MRLPPPGAAVGSTRLPRRSGKILRKIVPKDSSCILFAKHLPRRERDLIAAVCEQDLEGFVAK